MVSFWYPIFSGYIQDRLEKSILLLFLFALLEAKFLQSFGIVTVLT